MSGSETALCKQRRPAMPNKAYLHAGGSCAGIRDIITDEINNYSGTRNASSAGGVEKRRAIWHMHALNEIHEASCRHYTPVTVSMRTRVAEARGNLS